MCKRHRLTSLLNVRDLFDSRSCCSCCISCSSRVILSSFRVCDVCAVSQLSFKGYRCCTALSKVPFDVLTRTALIALSSPGTFLLQSTPPLSECTMTTSSRFGRNLVFLWDMLCLSRNATRYSFFQRRHSLSLQSIKYFARFLSSRTSIRQGSSSSESWHVR